MTKNEFRQLEPQPDFTDRIGEIVRTEGRVVDVQFDSAHCPSILNTLEIEQTTSRTPLLACVIQHLGGGLVRCLVAAPDNELQRALLQPSTQVKDLMTPMRHPLDDRAITEFISFLRRTSVSEEKG